MTSSRRFLLAAALLLFAHPGALHGQAPTTDGRFGPGARDRGLPHPLVVPAPYARAATHPANRLFRLLRTKELVPAEIGAVGSRTDGDATPWYFAKREGQGTERRLFGGDAWEIPRDGFGPTEARRLAATLDALGAAEIAVLRVEPRRAVLLQHDVLALARRLLDTGENPELLPRLAELARRLAVPARRLRALGTPLPSDPARPEGALAAILEDPQSLGFVEIERDSTRLFDARESLSWAKVYVAWPEGREALLEAMEMAREEGVVPEVPVGTRSVLAQGLVAWSREGEAVATPLVYDLREKTFATDDPERTPHTTTRDGIDIRSFELVREGLLPDATRPAWRPLDDEDQRLFRSYGTLKHTTQAAQCTLCHRRLDAADPRLAGFLSLRPSADPRPAAPGERERRAEEEFSEFLSELETAAGR